jgi:hypothetical protein
MRCVGAPPEYSCHRSFKSRRAVAEGGNLPSALNGSVNLALMQAHTRSENADDATLAKTFVSIPPLESMLRSPQHQIVYGRRGTGKTHLLKYLTNSERARDRAAIYIDVRTIGSSMGTDRSAPTPPPDRRRREDRCFRGGSHRPPSWNAAAEGSSTRAHELWRLIPSTSRSAKLSARSSARPRCHDSVAGAAKPLPQG